MKLSCFMSPLSGLTQLVNLSISASIHIYNSRVGEITVQWVEYCSELYTLHAHNGKLVFVYSLPSKCAAHPCVLQSSHTQWWSYGPVGNPGTFEGSHGQRILCIPPYKVCYATLTILIQPICLLSYSVYGCGQKKKVENDC